MWQAETTKMSFSQDDVLKATCDGNEAKLREMISEDKPKYGKTALHYAAGNGHTAIADLLVESGVDVHAKDDFGLTALHYAADNGHTAIADLLVETGIDVDAKDEDGFTALHCAAYRGHAATAELLMEAGADVDAENEEGKTALDIAEEEGHSEIAALLRAPPVVTAERQLFDALDLDRDGTVSYAELRKGFRGKRKDELRQLAEACGHQWQSLEGRLYDLPNTEGFSFQEFGACLSAAVEEET